MENEPRLFAIKDNPPRGERDRLITIYNETDREIVVCRSGSGAGCFRFAPRSAYELRVQNKRLIFLKDEWDGNTLEDSEMYVDRPGMAFLIYEGGGSRYVIVSLGKDWESSAFNLP